MTNSETTDSIDAIDEAIVCPFEHLRRLLVFEAQNVPNTEISIEITTGELS
jgi:hypothetical protein